MTLPKTESKDRNDYCEECETRGRNCLAHSRPGSPGVSIYDEEWAQEQKAATK